MEILKDNIHIWDNYVVLRVPVSDSRFLTYYPIFEGVKEVEAKSVNVIKNKKNGMIPFRASHKDMFPDSLPSIRVYGLLHIKDHLLTSRIKYKYE